MNLDECIVTYFDECGRVVSEILPKSVIKEKGDLISLKQEVRKLKAKISLMRSYEQRCKRAEETELHLMKLLVRLTELKQEQVSENDQLRWIETQMLKPKLIEPALNTGSEQV